MQWTIWNEQLHQGDKCVAFGISRKLHSKHFNGEILEAIDFKRPFTNLRGHNALVSHVLTVS